MEEAEKETHRKRNAVEGSIDQREHGGKVKSRMTEEEKDRTKKEEKIKGSFKREAGETRGDFDNVMNVDIMEEEELQQKK